MAPTDPLLILRINQARRAAQARRAQVPAPRQSADAVYISRKAGYSGIIFGR